MSGSTREGGGRMAQANIEETAARREAMINKLLRESALVDEIIKRVSGDDEYNDLMYYTMLEKQYYSYEELLQAVLDKINEG